MKYLHVVTFFVITLCVNFKAYTNELQFVVSAKTQSNTDQVIKNSNQKAAFFYLNDLSSFKADFVQTNKSDQSKQYGSLMILKPGLIKWEYKNPEITILIKKNWLTYYDRILDEYTYSPVDNSIYTLLSSTNINQINNINFINVKSSKNKEHIAVQDTKTQTIAELIFNKNPLFLSELNIKPVSEDTINLKFHNIIYNQHIDKKEFAIHHYNEYNSIGKSS